MEGLMKYVKSSNSSEDMQLKDEMENGILIVDDSKFSRNILNDILKHEGFNVIAEAKNGLEAIEMTKEKKPKYIFLDVEMPMLDGLGALPKILEVDPTVCIIMCTAMGQKNIIVEAAKAGAKDYVLKPYRKENIMRVLSVLVEAEAQLKSKNAAKADRIKSSTPKDTPLATPIQFETTHISEKSSSVQLEEAGTENEDFGIKESETSDATELITEGADKEEASQAVELIIEVTEIEGDISEAADQIVEVMEIEEEVSEAAELKAESTEAEETVSEATELKAEVIESKDEETLEDVEFMTMNSAKKVSEGQVTDDLELAEEREEKDSEAQITDALELPEERAEKEAKVKNDSDEEFEAMLIAAAKQEPAILLNNHESMLPTEGEYIMDYNEKSNTAVEELIEAFETGDHVEKAIEEFMGSLLSEEEKTTAILKVEKSAEMVEEEENIERATLSEENLLSDSEEVDTTKGNQSQEVAVTRIEEAIEIGTTEEATENITPEEAIENIMPEDAIEIVISEEATENIILAEAIENIMPEEAIDNDTTVQVFISGDYVGELPAEEYMEEILPEETIESVSQSSGQVRRKQKFCAEEFDNYMNEEEVTGIEEVLKQLELEGDTKSVVEHFFERLEKELDEATDKDATLPMTDYYQFTYLWENRFEMMQEVNEIPNPQNHRLSLQKVLEFEGSGNLSEQNMNHNIMSGMINAYLHLGNRFQLEENNTEKQVYFSFEGKRLYSSLIFEDKYYGEEDISMVDILKSSTDTRQNKVSIKKVGLTNALLQLVQDKSNRIL